MAATLAACRQGGLLVFANFNRIHVVPPCTVTVQEVRRGLAILDAALEVADAHANESGTEAPEPETRHDQREGVDSTPMGQTDLEQEERGTTDPGR